jgi:2-amino-4-hydroxy-6-hydroxymethyldihydropteridine diphosphokinase
VSAVVSLGSNLGDRAEQLRAGLEVLAMHLAVVAVSPVYETAPVGVDDSPRFLNAVAVLATEDPEAALRAAHDAETARGRMRPVRWGPRTLDVDVVTVDELVRDDPRLTLPHPRAHERAFVLRPWLDIDSDATLPGRGSVRVLLDRLPDQQLTRYPVELGRP